MMEMKTADVPRTSQKHTWGSLLPPADTSSDKSAGFQRSRVICAPAACGVVNANELRTSSWKGGGAERKLARRISQGGLARA